LGEFFIDLHLNDRLKSFLPIFPSNINLKYLKFIQTIVEEANNSLSNINMKIDDPIDTDEWYLHAFFTVCSTHSQ